eukprot:2364973-Rhodomonas_salina.1
MQSEERKAAAVLSRTVAFAPARRRKQRETLLRARGTETETETETDRSTPQDRQTRHMVEISSGRSRR